MGDFYLDEDTDSNQHPLTNSESNNVNYEQLQAESPTKAPMSPGRKIIYLMGSPIRFINRKFYPGSLKGSTCTLLAATVGAGILTLPYAVNLAGYIMGIINFFLGMLVSYYSGLILVKSADKVNVNTYEGLGHALYGPRMGKFAEINMMVNNYGTTVAYLVLIKGLIPHALRLFGVTSGIVTSEYFWGILITVKYIQIGIVYPLTFPKQINALRYTSLLSFCTCSYLAIVVVAEFFIMRSEETSSLFEDAPAFRSSAYGNLQVAPFVIFSYTNQANVLQIYSELKHRSVKRGSQFIFRALFMVFIIYIMTGIFGFLTFYDEYDGKLSDFPAQILSADYRQGDAAVIIASLAISITMLCGTPLGFLPARDSFYSCFWPGQDISKKKHFIVVTSMIFIALLLALVVPGIGIVVSFLGSVSNPIVKFIQICFIIPCMYYLKAFKGPWQRRDLFLCWFVLILMSLVAVLNFIFFCLELSDPNIAN